MTRITAKARMAKTQLSLRRPDRILDAAIDRFVAGESIASLARDYQQAPEVMEGLVRMALKEKWTR